MSNSRRIKKCEILDRPPEYDVPITGRKKGRKARLEHVVHDRDNGYEYDRVCDEKVIAGKQRQIKRRKKLKRIRRIFLFIVLTVAAILIAKSEMFGIKKIVVEGVDDTKSDIVLEKCALRIGQNVFEASGDSIIDHLLLRFSKAEEALKREVIFVNRVNIRYTFTGSIVINIDERQQFAQLKRPNGRYAVIDNEFVVLSFIKTKHLGLPVISGVNNKKLTIGKMIEYVNKDNKKWLKVITDVIYNDISVPEGMKNGFSRIDVSEMNSLVFTFRGRKIRMGNFSSMTQEYITDILVRADRYIEELDSKEKGIIDFTVGENAVLRSE